MKKISCLLFAVAMMCHGNSRADGGEMKMETEFNRLHGMANADYGTCYAIGRYKLCPEKKLILKMGEYGTKTADYIGFFPDPALKYDEATMIIFAGEAFFDTSGLNIDWKTAQLLSYSDHYAQFTTDGKTLYYLDNGNPYTHYAYGERYDKNTYKPEVEKRLKYRRNHELTESFYVRKNIFYYNNIPILEPFDVPRLRTIVSKSGYESKYITDGKQVLLGGGKTGYSTRTINGTEYVLAERWRVKGVDLPTLRVLGRNLLVDKNALYSGTEVIPFDRLNGFKFIIREM